MSNLSTLLKKYEALTLEIARLGTARVTIHDQILAAGRGTASLSKTPGPGRPAPAWTRAQIIEVVRETVRVLREAGAPLPRREIAARRRVLSYETMATHSCGEVLAAVGAKRDDLDLCHWR